MSPAVLSKISKAESVDCPTVIIDFILLTTSTYCKFRLANSMAVNTWAW